MLLDWGRMLDLKALLFLLRNFEFDITLKCCQLVTPIRNLLLSLLRWFLLISVLLRSLIRSLLFIQGILFFLEISKFVLDLK
jgi:hypothetical protein